MLWSYRSVILDYVVQPATSKMIEIAQRFSGDNGIVLQLNNINTIPNGYVRIFECVWVSNYANEAEYLFCGGRYKMQIESIRIMANNLNYVQYFRPLYYFDCMLSGTRMSGPITRIATDLSLLKHLITKKIYIHPASSKNENLPRYIINTFDVFTLNKFYVVLNIGFIKKYFGKLSQLIIKKHTFKKALVIQSEIFQLFTHLKGIEIIASEMEHCIDLISLSTALSASNVFMSNNVTIKIKSKHAVNWLSESYYELIKTEISKILDIELEKKQIKTRKGCSLWNVLTIKPLGDAWKCPICYYMH